MRNNLILANRFGANLAAYGIAAGPQTDNLGSSDMGNVSQVLPTIHPEVAICEPGVPGHSIEFRDAAGPAYADEVTLVVATVVAQTAVRALHRSRPRRGGLAGVPRQDHRPATEVPPTGSGRVLGWPRLAPLDARCEPAASPEDVIMRPAPAQSRRPTMRLPEVSMAKRHDPVPAAGFAAANGWDRDYEVFSDFDLPTYVGPSHVHEPALDHRSGGAARPADRRRDHRRAVRRRR